MRTASGDYDGEGYVDLLFTNLDETLTLLRDDTAMFNGYIVVDLLGKGVNPYVVGPRVGLRANSRT